MNKSNKSTTQDHKGESGQNKEKSQAASPSQAKPSTQRKPKQEAASNKR